MKVLIVGNDNGFNLESSYTRALTRLGHHVTLWSPSAALARVARLGGMGRRLTAYVRVEPWERKANLDLLHTADHLAPDLLLVISTSGVSAGTLGQLKADRPTLRLVCLYPDSPHNLNAERIASLPIFDHVYTSSPAWVPAFETLGARSASYLPFAADEEMFRPAEASPARDLAFVGNWREEREALLEHLSDFDLRVWGTDYWKTRTRKGSPLRQRWGGGPLFAGDLARACAEFRIMLNVYDAATRPGPNMRAFELPACRAFTLSERTDAALEMFAEGETAEYFSSSEEARDKARFYLKNDSARQAIARRAYEFVLRGHTYADRVKAVLSPR